VDLFFFLLIILIFNNFSNTQENSWRNIWDPRDTIRWRWLNRRVKT